MDKVVFYAKNLFVMRKVKAGIDSLESVSCDCVSSLSEAEALLRADRPAYFLSIVEAPLLDEAASAAVSGFKAAGLPPIVLTNEYTDTIREEMASLGIMDYIIKDQYFAENLLQTVRRVHRNMSTEIMIVDDSDVSRKQARTVLELQRLVVHEAGGGEDALRLLEEHPGVKLLLTDFNMPGMNGDELIRKVRKIRPKNRLAVIGFSDVDNPGLSVRLLKNGADDFIYKTFLREELYLRVVQNLEMLGYIDDLRRLSHTDYLTQLYNRRFFFEIGDKLFENIRRNNLRIAVAMLDIDHFKRVNDRFGHDVGDLAIQYVAAVLQRTVRAGDVVARYGGEEFCVIAVNVNEQTAPAMFERIRANVAESKIDTGDGVLSVTVSIGVAVTMGETLEDTVNRADALMYGAKTGGRNRVVVG
ncbi:MAG: diguanylate cyclase [Spirochaetales bacterium]|nr:diguanylate cyclase [Spirochaetales bacterium]